LAAQGEERQEVAETRWLGFTTSNLVTSSLPWWDTLDQVSLGKRRWQQRIAAAVSSSVSSLKGGWPERRRKRMQPNAHMSEYFPTGPLERASGGRKSGPG